MSGIRIDAKKNINGVLDWSDFTLKQAISEERNDQVLGLIKAHPDYKILILTWRSERHVLPLFKYLKSHGIDCDYMSGTKKTYRDSRVLVGTIQKIGTGFDEKAACENFNGMRINMLIKLGSTASSELLEQVAGRAFRAEFPVIVDFVDDHPLSEKHFTKVADPWYKSRNGKIVVVKSPYYLKMEKNKQLRYQERMIDTNSILDMQMKNFSMDNMYKSGNIKYDPTNDIIESEYKKMKNNNNNKYNNKYNKYNNKYNKYNNKYNKYNKNMDEEDNEEDNEADSVLQLQMQMERYMS
jgi:superfamily II DNA or RNA helicase